MVYLFILHVRMLTNLFVNQVLIYFLCFFLVFFSTRELIPICRIIHVGDKLKVYYGPTQDSTVTYEAKVSILNLNASSYL